MRKRANKIVAEEVADKGFFLEALRREGVASKFRRAMASQELKLKDLAERMDVTSANVSRFLSGRQNLTLAQLFKLADALELALDVDLCRADDYQEVSLDPSWSTELAAQPEGCTLIDLSAYRDHKLRGSTPYQSFEIGAPAADMCLVEEPLAAEA